MALVTGRVAAMITRIISTAMTEVDTQPRGRGMAGITLLRSHKVIARFAGGSGAVVAT
jgi:hypothetical protein